MNEGDLKRLEDELAIVREHFEAGLSARNEGRRMVELDSWREVRAACSRASVHLADLIGSLS